MSEPALKCENNAIFKQSYILKLFIAFKMVHLCCFGLRGHLDFPDFLKQSFRFNIDHGWYGRNLTLGTVGNSTKDADRLPNRGALSNIYDHLRHTVSTFGFPSYVNSAPLWPDGLIIYLKIWPFTTMEIFPNSISFAKVGF